MYTVTLASTLNQVAQIKALQNANLRRFVPVEVQKTDGYLTSDYTIEYLEQIHAETPAVVALDENGAVVGYALAITRETARKHELIEEVVSTIDSLNVAAPSDPPNNYILSGQLCVAKHARGHALTTRMYNFFREVYKQRGYNCSATGVAADNLASMTAHQKAGWLVTETVEFEGRPFKIVVLPF
ncbi:hypothetical protein HK100_000283 [Physocladia obscura]|uniref:N-acetyltransferase domain-containing protein n=1 Tax=Physocladia obscura TaxID=109957 RepID=A0AAD5T1D1_9FUNG|nr:hypothetical protein HK100_000283 [Physocladia obscura]